MTIPSGLSGSTYSADDGKWRGEYEYTRAAVTQFNFETNGLKNGDAGHGGYLSITIKDRAGTAMDVAVNGAKSTACSSVTLTFRGDAEMINVAEALRDLANGIERSLVASERQQP